jgi:CheY-like chemotaxis protein
MMRGRVWLESELGCGSRFHFTAKFGMTKAQSTAWQTEETSLANLPVLIVDEDPASQRVTEQMLRDFQMRPIAARSRAEGLAALREARTRDCPLSLVIINGQMSETDGFALAKELQTFDGLRCAIIMLLTSGGFRSDAARCRELGVAAYLTKPISRSELKNALLTVVNQRSAETQACPATLVTPHSLRKAGSSRALRILLAEDNRINQLLAVRLIEKLGHRVEVVADGSEALRALQKRAFDVVLMDIQMPVMDGFEFTSMLREKEKTTNSHQPIIALTAHALTGDRERCLAAGMDGYVSKPIRYQDLVNAIETVLPR